MKKAITFLILLAVFGSCGAKGAAPETEAPAPIVQTEVTFVHPTFVFVELTAAFSQGHVQFYDDWHLEQNINGIWTRVPLLYAPAIHDLPFHIWPNSSWEYRFADWRTRHGPLPIGEYRIWMTFWHRIPGEGSSRHDIYVPFAIAYEFDEFDLHIHDIRQFSFRGEVVRVHEGANPDWAECEISQRDAGAVIVRHIPQRDDYYADTDWLRAVWINPYLLARDFCGTPVEPLYIPPGTVIDIRWFGHLSLDGDMDGDMVLHIRNARLIEIVDGSC